MDAVEQGSQERSELHDRLVRVSEGQASADQLGIHRYRLRQPVGHVRDATPESSHATIGPAHAPDVGQSSVTREPFPLGTPLKSGRGVEVVAFGPVPRRATNRLVLPFPEQHHAAIRHRFL
jgi:hypothetical protein